MPAALVATVGVLLLGNLAKPPSVSPDTARLATAISAEAVFRVTPRDPAELALADQEQDAKPVKAAASRTLVKPKPLAANTSPLRRVVNEPATPHQVVSAPLPIAPIAEQAALEAATPRSENAVIGTLRSATAAVQGIQQWAARSVAGWFAEVAPPRPPVPVPMQDFQASM